MSNVEEYNMKLEVIKAIPDDQIKNPNSMPIRIYIQEAEHLYEWCQEDKDELTAKGLDWTVVEDLPVRCGALSEAESN
jgi:D-mannonate dehydratase